MNKIRKTPAGLDCPTVSSEEFAAVDDDKVCTEPIKLCSTDRVLRDASEVVHHLSAKLSYSVHFLPIEQITIVVEHQDRQNQLPGVTSYGLDHPVLFALQRHSQLFQTDDTD
ncbi:hypothetical protein TNCV_3181 [Trichonephila clavipes]|nr:hypothetical protein TNCV_3181 [Trichonephila clavipes]